MRLGRFFAVLAVLACAAGPVFSDASKESLACLMDRTKCQRAPVVPPPKVSAPVKTSPTPRVTQPAKIVSQPPKPSTKTATSTAAPASGVAADLEALLLPLSARGNGSLDTVVATAAFRTALGRNATGTLKKDERSFLHNMVLWSGPSGDLVQEFVALGPSGLALLTAVFRNADPATSDSLPQGNAAPVMGDAATLGALCGAINAGNVAITAEFPTDGQRLGWILATRAACEARAILLSAAIRDQTLAEVSDPEMTATCAGLVAKVLPASGGGLADAPDRVIERVKLEYAAQAQGQVQSAARSCWLAGLYHDDAGLSLAAALVLSALDAPGSDLLIATQLRWGIGVPADSGLAGQWLQRAARVKDPSGAMPGVLGRWTQIAWQGISP